MPRYQKSPYFKSGTHLYPKHPFWVSIRYFSGGVEGKKITGPNLSHCLAILFSEDRGIALSEKSLKAGKMGEPT